MIRGFWGHYVNGWVSASSTTPLPGLCTSGQILLSNSDVTHSEICPDLQRPGSGVVGLVMTHWLTWCPQNRRIMKCGIEKIMDRCENIWQLRTVALFWHHSTSMPNKNLSENLTRYTTPPEEHTTYMSYPRIFFWSCKKWLGTKKPSVIQNKFTCKNMAALPLWQTAKKCYIS